MGRFFYAFTAGSIFHGASVAGLGVMGCSPFPCAHPSSLHPASVCRLLSCERPCARLQYGAYHRLPYGRARCLRDAIALHHSRVRNYRKRSPWHRNVSSPDYIFRFFRARKLRALRRAVGAADAEKSTAFFTASAEFPEIQRITR